MAAARRRFVEEQTGAEMHHVGQFSMEPSSLPGNVENFAGGAQVPIASPVPCGSTANPPRAGQDVANISESHAGVTYTPLLENGDYYWSVTLTSFIVGRRTPGDAPPRHPPPSTVARSPPRTPGGQIECPVRQ